MNQYVVETAIDGPIYANFYVEAENEQIAADKAGFSDGTLIKKSYDTKGKVDHIFGVNEVDVKREPGWDVMGVYTDTAGLQPFTIHVQASSAREAMATAIYRRGFSVGYDRFRGPDATRAEDIEDNDLREECEKVNIRPVSVRPVYQLKPDEHLHEIEEFDGNWELTA